MLLRKIGPFQVNAMGLGCMNLSHAYGAPPSKESAQALLWRALDLGVSLFDTAALYGFGANETLLGETLTGALRQGITLTSKCGMTGVNGARVIDGRPHVLQRTCDESLQRLRTDVIDLYYLHRWDRQVPIEDSVGALADLIRQGKIRAIGLSEVSAETLRRAHAVCPIAAVQNEYSLWSRNPEISLLDTCQTLGVTLVAFSPLGRGFLTAKLRDVSSLDAKDIRRTMPRFGPAVFEKNLLLIDGFSQLARQAGCAESQLALAWLLAQGEHVLPIPGTTSIAHLEENFAASSLKISPALLRQAGEMINHDTVLGPRYPASAQAEIDTEEFP